MPAYHSFNEAQTRYGLIDPQLTKRGWNLADRRSVSLEVPVDGYDAALINGITDYCLYRRNAEVLSASGVRIDSPINFSKYVLKLEDVPHFADVVQKVFNAFILEYNYNVDQTRLLRMVKTVTVQKRRIDVGDLYEPPFANFGLNAVEKLFNENEVDEILELTKHLVI
jgi:type I site-specific restriction endonuclease